MKEKIRVTVNKDIEVLIPRYLDRRHQEIETFRARLVAGDFEALRVGGHSLKGSGGGYGFPQLSDIGGRIESASKQRDAATIEAALVEYADYLERLEVSFG